MFKNFVQNISRFLGFKIVRYDSFEVSKFGDSFSPIYIEFVGVAGVGKTTLFNKLNSDSKWISAAKFVRNHLNSQSIQFAATNSCYQILADSKIEQISKTDDNSVDKLYLLHVFYQCLIHDSLIDTFNNNATIISEEGLIHNFGNNIEQILESGENELISNLLKRRAIVYCISEPEIVARQIIKRFEETGKLLPHHKTKSFDELVAVQKQALKQKDNLLQLLKKHEVPILMIDTSNSTSENLVKINTFIKQLQKNK